MLHTFLAGWYNFVGMLDNNMSTYRSLVSVSNISYDNTNREKIITHLKVVDIYHQEWSHGKPLSCNCLIRSIIGLNRRQGSTRTDRYVCLFDCFGFIDPLENLRPDRYVDRCVDIFEIRKN